MATASTTRLWTLFLTVAAAPVAATECPSFDLPEAQQQEFCEQFEELLYAPYSPNQDRSNSALERDDVDAVISTDPLWGEVYRSDPKRTVELIGRIRDAGGLR